MNTNPSPLVVPSRLSAHRHFLCHLACLVLALAFVQTVIAQQTTIVSYGDTWKYNLPTSDPGTSWRTVSFNDASWASGPGLLGYETAVMPAPGIRTIIGNTTVNQPVYLFRKSFIFNGDPFGATFVIDHIVDDSVTYYLNGNRLGSAWHIPGAWNNLATGSVGDAAIVLNAISGVATGLVHGTNVFAAEVHQTSSPNSDMVFGAKLTLTSTPLTSSNWRMINFGTINNTANAADLADEDKDGLANLAEYALLQDPTKQSVWGRVSVQGSNMVLNYSRRIAALNEMTVTTRWASSPSGPWSNAGVTEQILTDDGLIQSVQAQVPLNGASQKFFHINVVRPMVALPSAPSSLAATTMSASQINLSWTDNASNETGFIIERKTGSGGTFAQIASVAASVTSYQNSSLPASTQYYYRVCANNAAGNSAFSNEANATTQAIIVVPAAPSGLFASAASANQINLSWTDNSNAETGFKIERKAGSGGTYTQIATVGANVTTYQNGGLPSAAQFYFRIRANNTAGDSAFSNEANATTQSAQGPACWKSFMTTYIGGATWSDGKTYHPGRANMPNNPLPPPGVTVTNIPHIREIVDNWAALGGTHISYPVGWDDTETSPGVFEFRVLDWAINYAASKGIKTSLYIWPILNDSAAGIQYASTVSWKYETSDVTKDINGVSLAPNQFMNFHSPRIANYNRWLHGLGAHLAQHQNSNKLGYLGVVTSTTKELQCAYGEGQRQSGFHSQEIAAYNQWYLSRYGTAAPYPEMYANSNTIGKRFYKFKSDAMVAFLKNSNNILKQYAPFRCIWDAGSFTDGASGRNVWAALANEAGCDGYKHNPGLWYPAAFDTRAAVGATGWASIEWTNEAHTILDRTERRDLYLSQAKISIDAGTSDVSFAFFDNGSDGNVLGLLTEIVQMLKASGYWNKPIPPPVTSGAQIDISVGKVMTDGYGFYRPAFDSALQSTGIYPNIKVTNDLP